MGVKLRPEAAAYLGVSESQIDLLTRRGELAVIQIGRCNRWTTEDLDEYIARSRRPDEGLRVREPLSLVAEAIEGAAVWAAVHGDVRA